MGVYQACPHPTLLYTLIVLRGPRGDRQEPVSPQHAASFFPRMASVSCGRRGDKGPRIPSTPCLLLDRTLLCQIPSESVARESWEGWQERPLFPRLLLGAPTAWLR